MATFRDSTIFCSRRRPESSAVSGPTLSGFAGSAGAARKAELSALGVSIGRLGQDDDQWCIVTSKDAAVALEPYIADGVLYYRNAADTSRYLSVSDRAHYVDFSGSGTGWTYDAATGALVSQYTGAQLSYWSSDNRFVYANSGSGYTPLIVHFY